MREGWPGLTKLAEKTRASIYRDAKISIKIKGGFKEGSFDYSIVFDMFAAVAPVAPQLVKTIKEVIEFRKFLNGGEPVKTEPEANNSSRVENNSGATMVVQNSTIIINNSPLTTKALQKFFSPLGSGINAFEVSDSEEKNVTVGSQEKNLFLDTTSKEVDSNDSERILEILTAQMDGKPNGWRFYDVEEEIEFSAGVADSSFLMAVNSGKYGILRGSHVSATVRTNRMIVDGRRRTERTIISLIPIE